MGDSRPWRRARSEGVIEEGEERARSQRSWRGIGEGGMSSFGEFVVMILRVEIVGGVDVMG